MSGAARYAAFLRGINVGGRRVSGDELAGAFTAVDGIDEATSFLASGNVVFVDEGRRSPERLSGAIEAEIAESLGFDSEAFIRTADELLALARTEPFSADQLGGSDGKPQVILLKREPDAAARRSVRALATDDDLLTFSDRELHWLPSGGISRSDLDLKAIEHYLGTGTTRTANTIRRLSSKHFAS